VSFHPLMDYGAGHHKSERTLPEDGPAFAFTAERRAAFEKIAAQYPPEFRKSAMLAALYLAQEQQGYITGNAMAHVAEVVGCTRAEVEENVAFYTMFYTRPMGRNVVQVCRTLSCALNGAERLTEALCDKLNVKPGEMDATGDFTVIEVECLGACDRAPVVMVNDDWHERARPEDAAALVDGIRQKGGAALTGCYLDIEKKLTAGADAALHSRAGASASAKASADKGSAT
jgi:NADH-quinone oxidoreductase E subunit